MFLACITLRASKLSHACYMHVQLIILYLIFQIMFCEEYKIIKFSLSYARISPPPPTSTLFINSLNLCCSLEVPHLHRTKRNIIDFYALISRYSDGPGIESRWGRDFRHLSRPAVRPTQPPVQRVPGPSRGVRCGRGVTLTPHPLPVPKSKIE
jgi:hypothetical protein